MKPETGSSYRRENLKATSCSADSEKKRSELGRAFSFSYPISMMNVIFFLSTCDDRCGWVGKGNDTQLITSRLSSMRDRIPISYWMYARKSAFSLFCFWSLYSNLLRRFNTWLKNTYAADKRVTVKHLACHNILDFLFCKELYPLELLQLRNHGLQVGFDIFGHLHVVSQFTILWFWTTVKT